MRLGPASTVMLLCTLAAGCAQIGEQVPQSFGGLPPETPARPQVMAPTPAVHDVPPARAEAPLTAEQQLRLEKDLAATRARHEKLQDPNAARRAEDANAASEAAIERARKKAGKPQTQ